MNIWECIDRDHVVIHSAGRDVMNSRGDLPRRHNQFATYRYEVLRHLDVVEEVVMPLLDGERAKGLRAEHKALRSDLKTLDRRDKTGEWNEDFSLLAQRFETACKRHDGLEHVAQGLIEADRAQSLGEDYEQAKLRHARRDTLGEASAARWGAALGVIALGATAAGLMARRRASDPPPAIPLEARETIRLISSKKVEGTPVLSMSGEKLGRIENFMVDKYTGRVAYAVLSFGGHLGFGRSLFPLPWSLLDYDESAGGYRLGLTREELENAPRFTASKQPNFDAGYQHRIIVYYEGRSPADRDVGRSDTTPVFAREAQPA